MIDWAYDVQGVGKQRDVALPTQDNAWQNIIVSIVVTESREEESILTATRLS